MIPLPKPKTLRAMVSPMPATPTELTEQMGAQRRTVDFDTFDIQIQQLLTMLDEEQISIAPAYQRQFRWDDVRCSQLIESLILGIPIPNVFMATNTPDNTWEVVDGLQRLCAIVKFTGSDKLRRKLRLGGELVLEELQKINKFNGATFKSLPSQYPTAHKDKTDKSGHIKRQER